jgi:hypothetical protein
MVCRDIVNALLQSLSLSNIMAEKTLPFAAFFLGAGAPLDFGNITLVFVPVDVAQALGPLEEGGAFLVVFFFLDLLCAAHASSEASTRKANASSSSNQPRLFSCKRTH